MTLATCIRKAHASNLDRSIAYLVGEVVAALDGGEWTDSLQAALAPGKKNPPPPPVLIG
jgi:hypothetical protein